MTQGIEEEIKREIRSLEKYLAPLEKLEQRDYMEKIGEICETRGKIKALGWVLARIRFP